MKDDTNVTDVWAGDKLGYEGIGHAFTNLVKSIDTEKVISIEAGFGRGKTFFRRAWAEQLRTAGEVVVEVDVQQSDHSGDPVITLLGALIDALPRNTDSPGKKALQSAKKIGAVGTRALTRAVLKSGADEVFEALSSSAIDGLDSFDALDSLIQGVGSEMSKVASQLIASQMAAEKVRKTELPEQLEALRAALVEGSESKRVVVIIDELDRCHPEYAISFLEATKLVFSQSGFVFCLMVNANYLESLARHRFGVAKSDEKYLDKFVDLRLKLEAKPDTFRTAVYEMACNLPLAIPYGEGKEFSVERAAELAGTLAAKCGFSMRKTERILLKVEVALRCYADRPLDAPLLVFLAFKDEDPDSITEDHLKRSFLTPEEGARVSQEFKRISSSMRSDADLDHKITSIIRDKAPELLELPAERYQAPELQEGQGRYKPWALVFSFLAPHYLPEHKSVLDGVASVLVADQ